MLVISYFSILVWFYLPKEAQQVNRIDIQFRPNKESLVSQGGFHLLFPHDPDIHLVLLIPLLMDGDPPEYFLLIVGI